LTGGLHSVVAKKEFIGDCILIPFQEACRMEWRK